MVWCNKAVDEPKTYFYEHLYHVSGFMIIKLRIPCERHVSCSGNFNGITRKMRISLLDMRCAPRCERKKKIFFKLVFGISPVALMVREFRLEQIATVRTIILCSFNWKYWLESVALKFIFTHTIAFVQIMNALIISLNASYWRTKV